MALLETEGFGNSSTDMYSSTQGISEMEEFPLNTTLFPNNSTTAAPSNSSSTNEGETKSLLCATGWLF